MNRSADRLHAADLAIAREALVSGAINAALSLAFFLLAFSAWQRVPVWGAGGYALDFLPQSFAIGLMSTLIPGLMARRKLAAGAPSTAWVVGRSLAHGLIALAAGGALWAALLWLCGIDTIGWAPALAVKLTYGAALGAAVTALSLKRMIG